MRRTSPPPPDPDLLRAVFDGSPWGIVVLDDERRVVSASPAAEELLGELSDGATCCRVLGCRRPGTALEGLCLTRQALEEGGGSMPEVRLDLEVGGQTRSIWVIAAPLPGDAARVVAHVRPGITGDRRRRTEPHWTRGPHLRIEVLGRTIVESPEAPLSGEWLGHRPGQLLKYLVLNRDRVVPVEELVEVFWPDARYGHAARTLRQAIHTLRERLEPARGKHAPSNFVAARQGGYQLEIANVETDIDEFEAGIDAGMSAIDEGDTAGGEALLDAALALRRSEFLADEPYAEWALPERERLRSLTGQALRALGTARLEAGELDRAIEAWQRLADLQPLDLPIQRELLRLMVQAGHHTEAVRRVAVIRRRFTTTFGSDPDLDLAALGADGSGDQG